MGQESKIEGDVCNHARKCGCYVRKFTGQRGVPDHFFLTPAGLPFFIEFKAPGKEPSPMQEREIREIKKRKGRAYCIDNYVEGVALVNRLLKIEIILL